MLWTTSSMERSSRRWKPATWQERYCCKSPVNIKAVFCTESNHHNDRYCFCHSLPAIAWWIFVPINLCSHSSHRDINLVVLAVHCCCCIVPSFSTTCDSRQLWVLDSPTRSLLTRSPWPAYPPIRQWPQVWPGENSTTATINWKTITSFTQILQCVNWCPVVVILTS